MYFGKRYQNAVTDDEEGFDRRTVLRRHLIYYLRVWNTEEDQLLGHLVDINVDGLMLISEKPIPTKKEYKLELRWNSPEGEAQHLRFNAESRWCNNDVNPAFYDTGFLLNNKDEAILEPIKQMIEELGFTD